MFPPDPLDDASYICEKSGQARAVKRLHCFAGDLLKMYTNYGLSQGWVGIVS